MTNPDPTGATPRPMPAADRATTIWAASALVPCSHLTRGGLTEVEGRGR